jgi:hypothetical protein
MTVQLLFGTSVAFGFIAWAVVATLYIWPQLRTRSRIDALRPLLVCLFGSARATSRGGLPLRFAALAHVGCWHEVWMPACPAYGRYRTSSGPQRVTGFEGLPSKMTPSGRSAVNFAVLHNGPHDVIAYACRPMGGLGETARLQPVEPAKTPAAR